MKKFYLLFLLLCVFAGFGYSQHIIKIELKTDNYGSETTWELRNRTTNTQLARGGPYSDVSQVRNIPEISVDGTGCYEFIIKDSNADGICCVYGNGYYRIYYDNQLLKQGGSFRAEDRYAGFGSGCTDNDVKLVSINSPVYADPFEGIDITGIVESNGMSLTSFDVTYKVDNGEFVDYFTRTSNITIGNTVNFTHNIPVSFPDEGIHTVTVKVLNPNGLPDDNESDNEITHTVIVNKDYVDRRVLIEQFSTESCGYCPGATTNIRNWLSSRQEVIWVIHHAGYYTDPYTIAASERLLSFYNANSTYAPAMMLDRTYIPATGTPGPVFSPSLNSALNLLNARRQTKSYATIEIVGTYNPTSRQLEINVSGELVGRVHEENLRLTVYLIQDGITTTQQSGYTGTYTHNNLLRAALSNEYGDTDVITSNNPGTTFSKDYTFNVNSSWNTANMKIVAFVNNWHPSDVNNRSVLNATQITFPEITTSTTDILAYSFGDDDYSPAAIDLINKTVNITVAEGTDISNLIAGFTLSEGATAEVETVNQVSGTTANDFTYPVIYSVIAQDGVINTDWTVNVSEYEYVESSEAEILSFSFGEDDYNTPIIDNTTNTITAVVEREADLTNLIASFNLSEGATAKIGETDQISGTTANSFESPVVYVVTAEDGTTTQNWTVTVSKFASKNARILTYTFIEEEFVSSVINSARKTIEVIVSDQLSTFTADFTLSDGAEAKIGGIDQVSGVTENDFSSDVLYDIMAEAPNVVENWTVKVSVQSGVGIDCFDSGNILIYPNPSRDIINIKNVNGATIQIINMLGQQIINIDKASNDHKLNVSGIEPGTYFVKITNGDNIITYKIIIAE